MIVEVIVVVVVIIVIVVVVVVLIIVAVVVVVVIVAVAAVFVVIVDVVVNAIGGFFDPFVFGKSHMGMWLSFCWPSKSSFYLKSSWPQS